MIDAPTRTNEPMSDLEYAIANTVVQQVVDRAIPERELVTILGDFGGHHYEEGPDAIDAAVERTEDGRYRPGDWSKYRSKTAL